MRGTLTFWSIFLPLACVASRAQAQAVPPDAGRTLDSIERAVPQLPPAVPRLNVAPVPAAAAPAAAGATSTRIAVQSIVFEGVSVFSAAQMQALVEGAIGQSLTLAELGALAASITRFYRLNDYLVARAFLPVQDIVEGKVTISVAEGRVGSVRLDNSSDVKTEVIAGFLKPLQNGDIVRHGPVSRSMLLLSDLPGVAAQTTLSPGTDLGTTAINVQTTPTGRIEARVEADNSGNRYTGRYRLGAAINVNNPLDMGDQFGIRLLSSGAQLSYARLAYALPVNHHGTRLGMNYAASRYSLGAEFASLNASGDAQIAGAALSHPLVRSESFNLRAEASSAHKNLSDRISSVGSESNKAIRLFTLSLTSDWRDNWLQRPAASIAAVSLGRGHVGLASPQTAALDTLTAQTAGSFSKWNWSATRWQTLGSRTSLYATASGQQALKNLDSSEKFALGGSSGVRAYPEGEAAGDSAVLVNVELRFDPLPNNRYAPQMIAFYDEGQAQLNKTLWTGFTGHNSRVLAGYGVGLTWDKSPNWRAQVLYARPAGPELATTDPDQGERIWLKLTWTYF